MRVSAVTGFTTSVNPKKRDDMHNTIRNYAVGSVNRNNSPSFGVLIIDNIFNWGVRKINKGCTERAQQQINKIRHAILDDVDILASRKSVSKETVQKEYEQTILKGGIAPKYDGDEIGLNKVVGYSLEKLETIKKAVIPIMETAEQRKAGTLPDKISAPSGIIIHGRDGGGKNFFAKSLLEHIDYKSKRAELPINTVSIDGEWWKGDTKENIELIRKTFKQARKNAENKKQTVILINHMDEILYAENNKNLLQELIKQTQHPKKDGITWIGTVENISNVPKPFFKSSRTGLFVEIDKPKSESEVQSLFYHFAANSGRESKFDDRYIMDYTRNSDIPFTPKKIKQIINFADDELRMSKDYSSKKKGEYKAPIEDMPLMMGVDYVARFNKDKVVFPNRKKAEEIPIKIRHNLQQTIFENKQAVNY